MVKSPRNPRLRKGTDMSVLTWFLELVGILKPTELSKTIPKEVSETLQEPSQEVIPEVLPAPQGTGHWSENLPEGWETMIQKDLILECLKLHPDRRYSAKEIHAWIVEELGVPYAITATQSILSLMESHYDLLDTVRLKASTGHVSKHYQLKGYQDACLTG